VAEAASGIYVITLADPASVLVDVLPAAKRHRWNADQEIIYIWKGNEAF
jgi:hypothetical protein